MKNNQQKKKSLIYQFYHVQYVTFNIELQHVQRTYWNYCISKKNAYEELWLSRHAWNLTLHPNAKWGDNVPPTNFQWLDSGVRTRGSEIKERGKETAKKAEKEKKRQSPTETSLQPLHIEEAIVWGTFQNVTWLCSGQNIEIINVLGVSSPTSTSTC